MPYETSGRRRRRRRRWQKKKSIWLHQPNVLRATFPCVPSQCIMQVVSLLAMNNAWKYQWPGHGVGIPALREVLNSLWCARAAFVFVGAAAAIISSAGLLMATLRKHGAEANNKADPARATNGRGGFSLSAFIGKAQNTWCTAGVNLAEPLHLSPGSFIYLSLLKRKKKKGWTAFAKHCIDTFLCQRECRIRKVMIQLLISWGAVSVHDNVGTLLASSSSWNLSSGCFFCFILFSACTQGDGASVSFCDRDH